MYNCNIDFMVCLIIPQLCIETHVVFFFFCSFSFCFVLFCFVFVFVFVTEIYATIKIITKKKKKKKKEFIRFGHEEMCKCSVNLSF